jgi:hypothetical protein
MAILTQSPELSNLIARYATYAGLPGYAIRTADRRVFFVDHDAQMVDISTADVAQLVLLGDVNTAERQHLLDCLAGGAAAICTSRLQEVR